MEVAWSPRLGPGRVPQVWGEQAGMSALSPSERVWQVGAAGRRGPVQGGARAGRAATHGLFQSFTAEAFWGFMLS